MKVRKSPHVVGHYAAGARLIGLTEKQMAKHLATLNATGGQNQDSPYAQPLCLFTTNLPSNIKRMTHTHGKIRLTIVVKNKESDKKDRDDEDSSKQESGIDASENVRFCVSFLRVNVHQQRVCCARKQFYQLGDHSVAGWFYSYFAILVSACQSVHPTAHAHPCIVAMVTVE